MKKVILSLLFSSFVLPSLHAAEITATSTITKVTVYQDRALVTRTAQVDLAKGPNAIVFENLPSTLIEESLRAEGKGKVPVTLFGAELKKKFVAGETDPRFSKILADLEKLQDESRDLQNQKNDIAGQRNFLNNISNFSSVQIPKEIMTKSSPPAEWQGMADYLLDAYNGNNKKSLELDRAIREKDKEIQAKQNELNELNRGASNEKKTAVVNVEAKEAGSFQVELSYLVPQATWSVSYDAKVYPDKKLCTLISYGNVRQWTGEDWKDVSMILSSAKPAVGGHMPDLEPWYVDFYRVLPVFAASEGMADSITLDRAKRSREITKLAFPSRLNQEANPALAVGGLPLEQVAAVRPQAQISQELGSVTFEVPQTMTVLSDNQLYKSGIKSDNFMSEFDYEATPKLLSYAFIHSKVTNTKDYSILAGDVNIFVNDNYVAKSSIPNVAQREKFDLYLGIDEDIKVKRSEIVEKQNRALLGLRARKDFRYKFTLENYKKDKIKLAVFDQVPVSKNADIKVEWAPDSLKPTKVKDLGLVKWEFELAPSEKKEFEFGFSIEYPADKIVSGV